MPWGRKQPKQSQLGVGIYHSGENKREGCGLGQVRLGSGYVVRIGKEKWKKKTGLFKMAGLMSHIILLTKVGKGNYKKPSLPCAEKVVKDDSNVVPFRTTKLTACTHFLSNVIRFKRFLSHLNLTLSWCLKKRIRSRWENLAQSYIIPFGPQLGSWEIAYVFHLSTEGQSCPRHN